MTWERLESMGMAAILFLTAIFALIAIGLARMAKTDPLPPLHFGDDEDGASARTIEDDLRDVA